MAVGTADCGVEDCSLCVRFCFYFIEFLKAEDMWHDLGYKIYPTAKTKRKAPNPFPKFGYANRTHVQR